jgi:hypothetical protein
VFMEKPKSKKKTDGPKLKKKVKIKKDGPHWTTSNKK